MLLGHAYNDDLYWVMKVDEENYGVTHYYIQNLSDIMSWNTCLIETDFVWARGDFYVI